MATPNALRYALAVVAEADIPIMMISGGRSAAADAVKALVVGVTGGIVASRRGECAS